MAYEKMNVYAYLEIINVGLKLLIVYLLSIAPYDKLVVYAFLLMVVSVIMPVTYRIYCIHRFPICRIRRRQNMGLIRSMLSFSALDLYGNIGVTVNSQGLTYAINIFFGVVYNAAVSLGATVNGMILSLTTTIAIAFKPQIVKQYAGGNIRNMESVMCNSIKFTLIAMGVLAIPCALEAPLIMQLWLGEVPSYSVEFLRIIIIQSFFPVINNVCNAAIHANGNIKALTFINGTVFMLLPVAIFLAFHCGANVLWGYGIEIIGLVIIISVATMIIRCLIPTFDMRKFIITTINTVAVISATTAAVYPLHSHMEAGLLRAATVTLASTTILGSLTWLVLFNRDNRYLVATKTRMILSKICR
jgi:polysaccharide biosynthesis protein